MYELYALNAFLGKAVWIFVAGIVATMFMPPKPKVGNGGSYYSNTTFNFITITINVTKNYYPQIEAPKTELLTSEIPVVNRISSALKEVD